MRIPRTASFFAKIVVGLALLVAVQLSLAQSSNTTTTRTNNPDGSTTVTTTTQYSDGSVTTETTYDKDGHDAGTTRTDVQTKDGVTTTTITRYDGNGHEIGKTITRVDKDGNTTVTNYNAKGEVTGTSELPPFKFKPDWKIGLDYKVPPEWRLLPKLDYQTQNSTTPPPAGTTRVSNADGTTITKVNIFKDGWIITVTRYDKDGHDAGTTRVDVQNTDGETTKTTTKWDGNGVETGKTVERTNADGGKTIITYDGQGHETGRETLSKNQVFKETLEHLSVKHTFFCDDLERHGFGAGGKDFQAQAEQLKDSCRQLQKQTAEKNQRPPLQGPAKPTPVGIVVPAQASGNISGIVTTEPKRYQDIPGLKVIKATIALQTGSDGKPTLQGIMVDTGDDFRQPAERPIDLIDADIDETDVTQNVGAKTIVLHRKVKHVRREPVGQLGSNGQFTSEDNITTPPVCLPGHITAVHSAGRFSGDGNTLLVSFAGQPVTPIAASKDVFFFQVPDNAHEGANQLVFADEGPDGWFAASAQVLAVHLNTGIANPNLHRGLRTTGTVGLSGGPQKNWSGANFRMTIPDQPTPKVQKIDELVVKQKQRSEQGQQPSYDPDLVNPAEIQKQVPDFHLPKPGEAGFLLLSITNRTPGIISIDGFKGTIRSWYLPADSLPFNTQLGIKAIADGGFDIGVIAQPFFPLKPMQVLTIQIGTLELK